MTYRIEALFRSKMGSEQWVRFDGPHETRADAERAMTRLAKTSPHRLRVVPA